ncbi:RDD family protein [Nonomuraea recticatena]|uniref:RDD family protein n=1 Tax=Nonomuraea recticatena TaxID=46178 RepID=UPI00361A7BA4
MQPPGAPAPLAEWWQRLVARIIDGLIIGLAGVVIGIVLGLILGAILITQASYDLNTGTITQPSGYWILNVITVVIVTLLYVAYEFFLTKSKGQTVGKMVMGIKITEVGAPLTAGGLRSDAALKRAGVTWGGNILGVLPFSLGGALGGLLIILNGVSQFWDKPLQQTFADKVAKTVVVKIK